MEGPGCIDRAGTTKARRRLKTLISLFDAGFISILLHPTPLQRIANNIHRAQERIDYLVQTASKRRDKIVLPAPALAEFFLLAGDSLDAYLTIIRKKSVFEIAGFNDIEAVTLVEQVLKGENKKFKYRAPETYAKLKYDRQIIAIGVTHRVECIYSTDGDLHVWAKRLNIKSYNLEDLPLPPPAQLPLANVVQFETGEDTPGQTEEEIGEAPRAAGAKPEVAGSSE